MDRNQLLNLVQNNNSSWVISKLTGKSQSTVRYWLKKYAIDISHKRKKRERQYECKCCGESNPIHFVNKGKGRRSFTKCKGCHNEEAKERFRKNKIDAIDYKGGKCVLCSYTNCPGSLHFHHRDPSQKDPNWRKMKNWAFDKIKRELDKCDLLCANCHGEVHWQLQKMGC